jgi:hypothetical protein
MARMIEVGTLRIQDGRGSGQRTVHEAMLRRVRDHVAAATREPVAGACVERWLEPGGTTQPPGPTVLQATLTQLGKLRETAIADGDARAAAYLELGAFCVEACLAELVAA